jgi:hypothetical protein
MTARLREPAVHEIVATAAHAIEARLIPAQDADSIGQAPTTPRPMLGWHFRVQRGGSPRRALLVVKQNDAVKADREPPALGVRHPRRPANLVELAGVVGTKRRNRQQLVRCNNGGSGEGVAEAAGHVAMRQ